MPHRVHGPIHHGRADNASLRVLPDVARADAVRNRTSCCESARAVAELASRALAMPSPLPVGSAAVVVAQCTSDVAWLPDAVDALRRANAASVSVYVYSKCAGERRMASGRWPAVIDFSATTADAMPEDAIIFA